MRVLVAPHQIAHFLPDFNFGPFYSGSLKVDLSLVIRCFAHFKRLSGHTSVIFRCPPQLPPTSRFAQFRRGGIVNLRGQRPHLIYLPSILIVSAKCVKPRRSSKFFFFLFEEAREPSLHNFQYHHFRGRPQSVQQPHHPQLSKNLAKVEFITQKGSRSGIHPMQNRFKGQ